MPLDPQTSYIQLTAAGSATPVKGGSAFWSLPPEQLDRYGRDWLVSEYLFDNDWPNWEMHPQADELVYLLSGSVEMQLEMPERTERVTLHDSGMVVIPRGIWHTAKVRSPSRMLHITMGAGTVHRPIEGADA